MCDIPVNKRIQEKNLLSFCIKADLNSISKFRKKIRTIFKREKSNLIPINILLEKLGFIGYDIEGTIEETSNTMKSSLTHIYFNIWSNSIGAKDVPFMLQTFIRKSKVFNLIIESGSEYTDDYNLDHFEKLMAIKPEDCPCNLSHEERERLEEHLTRMDEHPEERNSNRCIFHTNTLALDEQVDICLEFKKLNCILNQHGAGPLSPTDIRIEKVLSHHGRKLVTVNDSFLAENPEYCQKLIDFLDKHVKQNHAIILTPTESAYSTNWGNAHQKILTIYNYKLGKVVKKIMVNPYNPCTNLR